MTTHPVIGVAVRHAAIDYAMAEDPKHRALAVISEGIHARYLQGKTVGAGFDRFGPAVETLLHRAAAVLGEDD